MSGSDFVDGLFPALASHCERLGESGWVDHELAFMQWPKVHACTHRPTPDRPWVTVRTEGMSEEPLDAPAGSGLDRIELLTYWPGANDDDVPRWLTYVLRVIGHIPHDNRSHFEVYDTVLLTHPDDPFPDTNLVGALIRRPTIEPEDWATMPHHDGTVTFLELVLVTMDELDFKVEHGGEALNDRLVEAGVTALVDPTRTSAVQAR